MRFALLGLLFLAFPLLAQETVSLRNDREGESYYAGKRTTRAMKKALAKLSGPAIIEGFQDVLSETREQELCSFDMVEKLQERYETQSNGFRFLPGAIHYLRSQNEIDDVVVKLLLKAHATLSRKLNLPKYEENLTLPADDAKVDEMVKLIGTTKEKLRNGCFDEVYRSLYGELTKVQKKLKSHHLEALYVKAFQKGLVDLPTYKLLERARLSKLEGENLSLKAYYQKVQSLRTQYPLRDPEEKSNFVAGRFNKEKFSRRQRLLEGYSDLQIVLMGNVIKKLKSRLESNRIEISVYGENDLLETIPLEPMERFRFAIKILRKEMALLSLNTYFAGRTPSYIDLMTAAFEIGIVPGEELEEIAGLEEIWNPRKTFWDKSQVWVRSFASMSTLVIPPLYGFIPALAIVVIEATVGKNDHKTEDPTSLF